MIPFLLLLAAEPPPQLTPEQQAQLYCFERCRPYMAAAVVATDTEIVCFCDVTIREPPPRVRHK